MWLRSIGRSHKPEGEIPESLELRSSWKTQPLTELWEKNSEVTSVNSQHIVSLNTVHQTLLI